MPVSNQVIDQIRDTKTIGRSAITFVNGVLSVILTVLSGISSVSSASDAVFLRNMAIAFGAVVSILNLTLYLTIDIMISVCTDNVTDEKMLINMFGSDPAQNPDQTIVEGTQMMLTILNQMKLAGNNLNQNTVNDKTVFNTQLLNLENALNKFGTMSADP